MSARVNVKFVVLLSVVLIAAMGGVVWAAMVVVMKSGDDHAARAAEFEAAGNYTEAEKSWAKAVNHDPARLDWLEGWRYAMEQIDHPTDSAYEQDFPDFRNILRATAEAKGADFDAHEEHLSTLGVWIGFSSLSIEAYNLLDQATSRTIRQHAWPDDGSEGKLRRHRGQYGAALLSAGVDLDDEQIATITEDLELALAADPSDVQSLSRLVAIKEQLSQDADRQRRDSDRDALTAEAHRLVTDFAQANPENLRAQAMLIQSEISQELQSLADAQIFGSDLIAAQRRILDRYSDRVIGLVDAHASAGAENTNAETTSALMTLTIQAVTDEPVERVLALWDTAASDHPGDVLILASRAEFLKRLRRYGESIDAFREIAELDRPTISAEGLLLVAQQRQVNAKIADAAFEQWRMLPARSASRDEWLTRAREARIAAGEDLPAESLDLVLLDAKLNFADGEYNAADRLIRRYNNQTDERNPSAVKLAADIAGRLGNAGEQRRLLIRAVSLDRNDLLAIIQLADINMRLRNYGEAERLYAMAADQSPNNEALQTQLDAIRALAGTSEVDDPIQMALIEARQMQDSGDGAGAIGRIEQAIADNPDPEDARLHITLASLLINAGEYERAAEITEAGLRIEPESASLDQLRRQAEIGDNAELAEQAIEELDTSEADKWRRKYHVRNASDDPDGATEAINRALELEPDNAEFLRLAFDHALRTGEIDRAAEIADLGTTQDLDGANGLAMQARIHVAEGRLGEAERALNAAVERGSLNPRTLQLLAEVQLQRGNTTSSLDNFGRALEIRPNDIDLLTSYLRTLSGLGRYGEALQIARDSVDFARNNPFFTEIWLSLEGVAGNKQLAYDERTSIAEQQPENADNTAALIDLAIDLRRFDDARRLLDEARSRRDSLRLVTLDARWHADRNELNGAVAQFTQFLVSDSDEASTPAPYIAFGSFLLSRGQVDRGMTTLRQGRQFQDPANPIVDATLGQELFRLRQYNRAIEVFESIIDGPAAGSPIANTAAKRLIESYTRIGEWKAAEARVDQLDPETRDELVVRLLRANIAEGQNQTAEARRLVDEAINAYPDASQPYVVRATMLMQEPGLVEDAIEDLSRAIELNPSDLNAYRLRSAAYASINRMNNAVRDIEAAVNVNPDNAELRIGAAARLIDLDREDQAADIIDAGLDRQAGNLQLLVSAGNMFADLDRPRRAAQYYEPAWEQTGDPAIGARLVSALLDFPRPDIRRARQIAGSPELNSEDYRVLLMRAAVESKAEDTAQLERLLTEAYRLVRDDPETLNVWAMRLVSLLGSREAALGYLARLDRTELLSPWGRFAYARILAEDPSGLPDALAALNQLVDGSRDPAVRLQSIRFRSIVHYEAEQYQRAADDMQRVLDLTPGDAEMMNNLAYTMAVHLDQADLAVPLAEQAAELRPDNRGVLDTLGVVYLAAGRPDAAISPLERALSLSTADLDKVSVLIHLAEARLESGNAPGADNAAQEARAILAETTDAPDELSDRLDDVLAEIRRRS